MADTLALLASGLPSVYHSPSGAILVWQGKYMSVLQWAEERSQAMTIWDIGVLKIYCVLFGVIVGAYVPTFVTTNVWWFVALVLILGVRGGHRFLTAEPR